MPLQEWIHRMEEGAGARVLKLTSVFLGFVALALIFDMAAYRGFSNQEAMESAQLGRQLARGKGYTTDSIRPLTLYLLQQSDPAHAREVLRHPVPDLSVAPGYPFVLACVMKALPFNFAANPGRPWFYEPDLWIAVFNELLFFGAALLLFQVARRLFDDAAAWLAAILFAGTELFWNFSVSGLSTIWLVVIFLGVVLVLVVLDEREGRAEPPRLGGSLAWAALGGGLVGIGGLSRYSFAWMIVPVLLFLRLFFTRAPGKLTLVAGLAFLTVMAPWLTRNVLVSKHAFGTADYALFENTPPLPEDSLERSLNPAGALARVAPRDLIHKVLVNGREILRNDLPRLGGNWIAGFFLCGLLIPYRSASLRRFRWFLVWSVMIFVVVQAAGQTHLSTDSPGINSENLLALLAPLALIYGVGFFFTLTDQIVMEDPRARAGTTWIFAMALSAPLLLTLAGAREDAGLSPYAPFHVQKTAAMMQPDELMMSDIPWAVAWYGDRPCVWLTLDDSETFKALNGLKTVHAVYLTQRTTDRRFLSQMLDNQSSWAHFLLESLPNLAPELARVPWAQGEVPTGFPLKKGLLDYVPEQMFISDWERWKAAPGQEKKL